MSQFAGALRVVADTGPAGASDEVRGAAVSLMMGFEVFLPYYLVAQPNIKSVGLDPDKDANLGVGRFTISKTTNRRRLRS